MPSRFAILTLTLLMLALAACQPAPTVTETPVIDSAPPPATTAPTSEPGIELTAESTQPLLVDDITMPPPGTLVTAAVTEDPRAGIPFDSIIFEQSGGITATTVVVEVYSDGRVVRDGVESTISAEQVAALDSLIKSMNFFDLQGQFAMPGQNEDIYYYKITVEQAGSSRTINAQDGYTPDPLMDLFNTISVLGTGAPPA